MLGLSSRWQQRKAYGNFEATGGGGGGLAAHPDSCDPVDGSPPGSSVYGILQARILEWVAVLFSRGIFPASGTEPRSSALQADSSLTAPCRFIQCPVLSGGERKTSCFWRLALWER